jgi:short-subunit dehydrogenase
MDRSKTMLIAGVAAAGAFMLTRSTTVLLQERRRRGNARRLRGKVVLITGASRGLGLALAEEFGRAGARLVLTARDPWELERARALLIKRNAVQDAADVLIVSADLRQKEEAEHLIAQAARYFSRIDVLVNNAGVITVGPVENQTSEDFHDVMDSNFFSGLHCTLSVLPQMLERGSGSIVNITSIGGKLAVPHLLPYTASKFAAVGFSEGLHAEIRSKGVHVLTVCPGLMRTGSHLNARFSGNAAKEYRWFSLSANLPGVSASAARAARRIVRAVLRRETEIAITPQAVLGARLAGIAPVLTARAMDVVNRFLPDPVAEPSSQRRGAEVRSLEVPPAGTIGWWAAQRYNQTGSPTS